MAKKKKPADLPAGKANATTARVRVAPEKRSAVAKRAAKTSGKSKRTAGKQPPRKLFDAKKWLGIFPDMAEWYIGSLREEARLNEEKADRLAKALPQHAKGKPIRRTRRTDPGVIDVDRFFGAMPHLKGDAVKVQRQMRDEW